MDLPIEYLIWISLCRAAKNRVKGPSRVRFFLALFYTSANLSGPHGYTDYNITMRYRNNKNKTIIRFSMQQNESKRI